MENKAGRVGPLDFAPTAVVPFYFLLLHFVVESSAQRQTEVKLRDDLDATDEKKDTQPDGLGGRECPKERG